jgi:hypothetical protein
MLFKYFFKYYNVQAYFGRKEMTASILSAVPLFYPEDKSRSFPQNTGNYSSNNISHSRRLRFGYSPL